MEEHTENTEHDLIQDLKRGSHKAFDRIYRMYSKRLYAYSLQFTKSPEESEEIVQEVFIKLWSDRLKIKQDETLRSLLFIMAKHRLINAWRFKVNHPVYEDYVNYLNVLSTEDAHKKLEYNEFLGRFRQIMKMLPLTQQKVIHLSRIKQLSNKEIAEALSLSEQTVKNQLSLGLKALKEKLNKVLLLLLLFFMN